MALATFGAGCFWGVEATFAGVAGVTATRVGYAGGHVPEPTYEMVCTDRTGHAEVVEVTYDPDQVSYAQLVEHFWECHDPTTLNRQGPDHGTQYRSVIFCHTADQHREAEASKAATAERFPRPIVTEILPAPTFWEAEGYHQQYLAKRGLGPRCQ